MKRIIYFIILLLIIITIFIASSKNSYNSNKTSKGLIKQIVIIYEKISNKKVNYKNIIKKYNPIVRKIAHFTIFMLLGIFIYLFLSTTNINNKLIISIIISIFFAIIDETHQIFTYGRTALITDVLIDSLGSITGIFIINKKI